MQHSKGFLKDRYVETIYFGGGTPSLLPASVIEEILNRVYIHFNVAEKPEITIEANPDDICDDWLKQIKNASVNRLSIGVQSFSDADLKFLGRIHNSKQALDAVRLSLDAGFDNLSVDFIYGIQRSDGVSNPIEQIKEAVRLAVPHISAYALTAEENTLLYKKIQQQQLPPISEDKAAEDFLSIMDFLESENYVHYEISNWAKKGYESKHNSAYWQGKHYLGLGPSAHSYDGETRRWNIADIRNYIDAINRSEPAFEEEKLTTKNKFNETVMLGLRTHWGCSLSKIKNDFGEEKFSYFCKVAQKQIEKGLCIIKEDALILTRRGKLFADRIASDFFL